MSGHTAPKAALAVLFAVVLLLGSFGMVPMGAHQDGAMTDCPFSPGVAVCGMSLQEMIAASQNLLTSMLLQKDFVALLSLLITAALGFAFFWKPLTPLQPSLACTPLSYHRYIPRHILEELFSRGILNPKPF